jgi:hypothetical protein
VSRFAFAGAVGTVSDVISDDRNFYVCRIETRLAATARAMDEVADVIRQTLVREKKVTATMVKANAFRRSATVPDVSFEQAAAQYKYTVTKTDTFTVAAPMPVMGARSAFAQAALMTPPGAVAAAVESGNAVYVLTVDGRRDPDEALFQARAPQIRDQIYQEKVQAYVTYWYDELRKQSTIEDFRDAS